MRRAPSSTLFPYTTLFRSDGSSPLPPDELPLERARRGEAFDDQVVWFGVEPGPRRALTITARRLTDPDGADAGAVVVSRSEEHTSELQSQSNLVCRLLLEK